MKTFHQVFLTDSSWMDRVEDNSVALVVTSPPYPMIRMWDSSFCKKNPDIEISLCEGKSHDAWLLMHSELEKTWKECIRVLIPGGILCINIGDATRTTGGSFSLYPNHARIITGCIRNELSMLPSILWRKTSNKPNKFMGSGMLPTNAYVTLEHEHILIFRKGGSRVFHSAQKDDRGKSAIFWEERNSWFSDIWHEIRGTGQAMNDKTIKNGVRERSAAFPFEIPFRLINMFSIQGDTVLDPFLGTGTTTLAALASGRNSIGFEREEELGPVIRERILTGTHCCRESQERRIRTHSQFMNMRMAEGKKAGYPAEYYPFGVVTIQERQICLPILTRISEDQDIICGEYA